MRYQCFICVSLLFSLQVQAAPETPVPVTVDNFVRAETDMTFANTVKKDGLGKLEHQRNMASIDEQPIVRMNRDTLYSMGVYDLEAGPVTITLPDVGKRYMSMAGISQDHYVDEMVHGPGMKTYTQKDVGTRYMAVAIRTLADPNSAQDMKEARAAQDKITVEQKAVGTFEIPKWDTASLTKVRNLLKQLSAMKGTTFTDAFGKKSEVNPVAHLLGTAAGWGGNPKSESIYTSVSPKDNSGKTAYRLTVGDVPVEAFWSISVYNAAGYFEKNKAGAYSVNSLTAKKNSDGKVTVQFGECSDRVMNCLPIMKGWSYTVRMYKPKEELMKGQWTFPEAEPISSRKNLSQLQ
ncbi:DUF1214 domain-containing protein [Bdellovibrio sp. HCB209]|uniref:DUF1214 domain-containing protein n=1 Tax=Bdellovibrio sp. HCB209 TaxID=3394354 RepID=UPI0039B6A5AD